MTIEQEDALLTLLADLVFASDNTDNLASVQSFTAFQNSILQQRSTVAKSGT